MLSTPLLWASRHLARAFTLFCIMAVFAIAVFGQAETGQISGTVTDPNGAVVPGANVTVKSVNTSATRTATASEEGVFTITNLQPGLYDVTVQAGSFEAKTERIEVTTGGKRTADIQLGVAAVAGEVTIAAEGGAEVNTTNQELSDVVTGTQLRE
ncbi:MAG TPA: carboxypeptidase-like regulatory domain-containing protein, partial [Pyrinomonadaceae bacterium]|nr:carboxypeptidase-like regulatory domain-containing protein [Pyrinomonadaceae bacterium]